MKATETEDYMKIPGKISEAGKRQPFKVPEGYFNKLPDRIMHACKKQEASASVIHLMKPVLSLAALFIGVAVIAFFTVQTVNQQEASSGNKQKNIAKAEYEDTHSNHEELLQTIRDSQHKEQANQKQSEQYIDYLLKEDVEYTTIVNELEESNGKKEEKP